MICITFMSAHGSMSRHDRWLLVAVRRQVRTPCHEHRGRGAADLSLATSVQRLYSTDLRTTPSDVISIDSYSDSLHRSPLPPIWAA